MAPRWRIMKVSFDGLASLARFSTLFMARISGLM
jgi:hypothetical protein